MGSAATGRRMVKVGRWVRVASFFGGERGRPRVLRYWRALGGEAGGPGGQWDAGVGIVDGTIRRWLRGSRGACSVFFSLGLPCLWVAGQVRVGAGAVGWSGRVGDFWGGGSRATERAQEHDSSLFTMAGRTGASLVQRCANEMTRERARMDCTVPHVR